MQILDAYRNYQDMMHTIDRASFPKMTADSGLSMFLNAGIAAGAQFIETAKLRSVISDMNELDVANGNFASRYQFKPGDHPAAMLLFPGFGESDAACNGNGDGIVRWNNGSITDPSVGDEGVKGMYHLHYSGIYQRKGGFNQIENGYANHTSMGDARWFPSTSGYSTSTIFMLGGDQFEFWFWTDNVFPTNTHAIYIVDEGIEIGAEFFLNGGISAADSFLIDEKIDDGRMEPGVGPTGAESRNFRAIQGGLRAGMIEGSSAECKNANVYSINTSGKACITGKKLSV